ncbi:transglutaminase-like domain-containing protein [Anaeromyxobacter paludicola]|uniref:Transglutaminase n=1 Tax=Anaeromyxobacter paludicola TaxID=2918171 RepID=A0ABM7XC86_9BACT|nr:transglutaminase-like domain-containing protein [Anaeromyxobacter paludicola]BDG09412.1 transglutaminase [Anaeromyxobacter paludicola]
MKKLLAPLALAAALAACRGQDRGPAPAPAAAQSPVAPPAPSPSPGGQAPSGAGVSVLPSAPGGQGSSSSGAGAPSVLPSPPGGEGQGGAARRTSTPPPGGPATILTVRRPAGPEWFGLYLVGKKAGWSTLQVTRETRAGADVLVSRAETVLEATVGGKQVRRSQKDEKVYEARPGGRLLSFSSAREGDGGARSLEARCTPTTCEVTLSAPGAAPERRSLPAPGETAEQADAARLAAATRGTVKGPQLETEQLRVRKMEDVYLGREPIAGAGVQTEVSVVREQEESDRLPARVSVTPDGHIAEIRYGDSLVARAESPEVAKRLDQVDLFNLARVPLPRDLPRTVPGAIRYELMGLPPGFRRETDGGRQGYAAGPGGATVLTVRARLPRAADPARDPPRAAGRQGELLEATPEIDWQDPALTALSKEVVGDARGTFAASTRLVHHVFGRLEKVYGASHDRATEVLAAGKGDCTEHALLFLALARAAGVPARGVHGLVYTRYADGVPALYWHAWAEVKAGDEWIAVDPTFDQPVADATHVALGRGTQVDTVGLLGALKVLSAEPVR